MKKLAIIFMLWIWILFPVLAQTFEGNSNLVNISMKPKEDLAMNEEIGKSGKYYALLIGVQNYEDPEINDLNFPLNDVNDMENILSSYYTFEKENIETLRDPSRAQMIIALDKLNKKLTENDNLLIFYAGHGYYREDSKQGFWLPSPGRT